MYLSILYKDFAAAAMSRIERAMGEGGIGGPGRIIRSPPNAGLFYVPPSQDYFKSPQG